MSRIDFDPKTRIGAITLNRFQGLHDRPEPSEISLEESTIMDNWVTDEKPGTLKKMKGLEKMAFIGHKISLNTCEDDNWDDRSGGDVTADLDSTYFMQGEKSILINPDSGQTAGEDLCSSNDIVSANMDLTAMSHIGLWLKSNTAIAAGVLEFVISNNANIGTPTESIALPAITVVNVWHYIVLEIADPSDLTSVSSVGFTQGTGKDLEDTEVYIDGIETFNTYASTGGAVGFAIHECEDNWDNQTGVSCASETTTYKVGSKSQKFTFATGFTTGLIATDVITSINISKYEGASFWIRSSIDLRASDLALLLDDSATCASPQETLVIDKPLRAATWYFINLTFVTPSNLTAVISVGIQANRDFGVCSILIDDIRATKPVKAMYEFEREDGTREIIAEVNETIWRSANGREWLPIASTLSADYTMDCATLEDECFMVHGNDYSMEWDGTMVQVMIGTSGNALYMPKGRQIEALHHKLWIGYADNDPTRVKLSDPAYDPKEQYWFPASAPNLKEFIADQAKQITGLAKAFDRMILFKENAIIVLSGYNGENWHEIGNGLGCTNGKSIAVDPGKGRVYFWHKTGLWYFNNGFQFTKVSDPRAYNIINDMWSSRAVAKYNLTTLSTDWDNGDFDSTTSDIVTTPGDLQQEPQTTQADFEANAGEDNVDDSTVAGQVTLVATTEDVVSEANQNSDAGFAIVNQRIAQSFTLGTEFILNSVTLYVKKEGSPTDSFYVEIRADVGGQPAQYAYLGQSSLATSSIGTSYAWKTFDFTGGIKLEKNTTYWIYTYAPGITVDNYIYIGYQNTNVYVNGNFASSNDSGAIWSHQTNWDFAFKVNGTYYASTGYTISQTLDLGTASAAIDYLNNLTASISVPTDTTLEFLVETKDADAGWGTYTSLGTATAGETKFTDDMDDSSITARQYIQWKCTFTATKTYNTPVLYDVWVGTTYFSESIQAGGSLSAWGLFEAQATKNTQLVNYYYAVATSEVNTATCTWLPITSGETIVGLTSEVYLKYKIQLSTDDPAQIPVVHQVTINWYEGASSIPIVDVASEVWENKYFLTGVRSGERFNKQLVVYNNIDQFNTGYGRPIGDMIKFNNELWFGHAAMEEVGKLETSEYFFNWGDSDRDEVIDSDWQTGMIDCGTRNNYKLLQEMWLHCLHNGGNVIVSYRFSQQENWQDIVVPLLGTGHLNERIKYMDISAQGFFIQFRFRHNNKDEECTIYSLDQTFELMERYY